MERRRLGEIKDLWTWREETGIDDVTENPVEGDMPRSFPCVVVWDEDMGTGTISYLFVHVTDIFNL